MKKRILSLVLALSMLCAFAPVIHAEETSGTCGDNLTWTLDGDGTLTISGEGEMTAWSDSSHAPWFSPRGRIKNTVIEKGVTSISDYAFYLCSSLTSITIPDSVTSIGDYAFYYCDLTSITIPNSVTSIGERAFYLCDSLTSITIPNSVTSIGDYAFDGCDSLTSVTIPNSVTSIGNSAFASCDNLTSVTISNSVTSIGNGAFASCKALTSVTIPNSVTSIGNGAFASCKALTSVTIPDSVTSIGRGAFRGCESLTSVTIPNSVTSIEGTFFGCTSLESVTIPDSVTSIGVQAFYYCEALTSVTIPDSVTSIGFLAFFGCTNLTSVTIPDSVIIIDESAFASCSSLISVTIPGSVTSIGAGVFSDCESLTNINVSLENEYYCSADGNLFDKTKTKLIKYAVGKTDSSYTIPDSVTSIGYRAFYGCKALTNINVSSENEYYCSADGNLFDKKKTELIQYAIGKTDTSYTIPDSVTNISDGAFGCCEALTSVTIPSSVTSIGYSAFYGCESLTSVTIPSSVTSIGGEAFYGCESLTSVTIPSSVTSIDSSAFYNCKRLTSVTIPDSITSIYYWTFYGCESLTSVTIPSSVTSIDYSAFCGCDSLTDVYYGGSEEEWKSITIYHSDTPLTNAAIHYNCGGGPAANINKVTINGHGTAYGHFQVFDESGNLIKKRSVTYRIDNSGAAPRKKTDENGYLLIEIKDVRESHDYNIHISGSNVKESDNTLSVTVKPLEYTETHEAIMTKGASIGIGIGASGSIGNLEAEAEIASAEANGSNEKSMTIGHEKKDGKDKLSVVVTENSDIALSAKAGLFAEAGQADLGCVKLSAGDLNGKGSFNSGIGAAYENDDFDIHDSDDVLGLSKFMLCAMLENANYNVASRYIIDALDIPVSYYQSSYSASVEAGANLGVAEIGASGVEASVTLAGRSVNTLYSHSSKTDRSNNSKTYSSEISAESGYKLLDVSVGVNEEKTSSSTGVSLFGNGSNNKWSVGAVKAADDSISELSITGSEDKSKKIFWNAKTQTNNKTISYRDGAAEAAAAKYDKLKDFSEGNKGFFSLSQMEQAVNTMTSLDETGTYTKSTAYEQGIDANLSASVQLLVKIGACSGISGIGSYEYETESGIYENSMQYTQARPDIKSDVEDSLIGIDDIVDLITEPINNFLSSIWDTVSGLTDKAVKKGQAAVEAAESVGDTVRGWWVSITQPTSDVKSMSILAVDSEFSLFSTSSVATTIGNPYIISIEDEDGNEIADFSENPFLLTLEYTQEQLDEAGVTDINDVAIYRWDDEKCVYICMGGTLDTENNCVKLEITKPGQYILAADNCPPAVTEFKASDSGSSPEITAVVSDMSGVKDFTFSIDGEVLVNNDNLSDYYDAPNAKFAYPTENLSKGSHTAEIYASDYSGNAMETPTKLEFSINTDAPVIGSVSELPETVSGEISMSAEVSGDDIAFVFLNIEETDAFGRSVHTSKEMTEENGVYTAEADNITSGVTVSAWVSAYNSDGNCAASDTQTALSVPDGPALVLTDAYVDEYNENSDSITVKSFNCEDITDGVVILAIYDADGTLRDIKQQDFKQTVTFDNLNLTDCTVKAMLWDGINSMKPLAAAAEI